jgi:Probable zinc-ribbon domain
MAGEQEFFHEKRFCDPPKRCKDCRQMKKDGRVDQKGGNR